MGFQFNCVQLSNKAQIRHLKHAARGPHAARERIQCGPPTAFQNIFFEIFNEILVNFLQNHDFYYFFITLRSICAQNVIQLLQWIEPRPFFRSHAALRNRFQALCGPRTIKLPSMRPSRQFEFETPGLDGLKIEGEGPGSFCQIYGEKVFSQGFVKILVGGAPFSGFITFLLTTFLKILEGGSTFLPLSPSFYPSMKRQQKTQSN